MASVPDWKNKISVTFQLTPFLVSPTGEMILFSPSPVGEGEKGVLITRFNKIIIVKSNLLIIFPLLKPPIIKVQADSH